MFLKSFEIISKFFASQNSVTVVFDNDGGANADLKNDVLHLPKDIANENALGALALLAHEAAHLKYSKGIPVQEVAPMNSDFHILNAIEDIRIDCKNFQILPNVFGFYEELVKKHMDLTKVQVPKAALRLCAGILYAEGFNPKMATDDRDFIAHSGLIPLLNRGTNEIEHQSWKELKKTIQEIKTLLKIDPNKDKPNTSTTIQVQQSGQDSTPGQDSPSSQADGSDLADVSKIMRPASVWSKGTMMTGGSAMATSPLAMDEQCANQFKEILNVKENKTIHSGNMLDTENLIAYHTGDVDLLFKDEQIVRRKKSKIMFLLDCSGSMGAQLLDNRPRGIVVKSCVQRLTKILDEVSELEGVNVDWAVSMFNDSYIPLSKANWQQEYTLHGGTCFLAGFTGALEELLKDHTIEGKRIILVLTDGDVCPKEIEIVNAKIAENHSDVRSLVIGVGSDMTGKFVKDLVGERVILAESNATEIILESVKAML